VLCRKADDFELGTNFDAWAVTVAHYQILSYRKTQARDRLVFTDEVMNIVDDQQGDNTARERVLKQLRRCFQALSVDNRAFLILRYEGGLSMAQMAMEVSKTAGAVRVKLHRLRRGLRDCVQNHLRKEKA
jgi:RNA polymerase sigma-70 factor (ECF subfamily)